MLNGCSEKSETASQHSGKNEIEKPKILDRGMEMNTKQ